MSPLLALSGPELLRRTCLLLGVKRTWGSAPHMSAFDPKRTFSPLRARPLPVGRFKWLRCPSCPGAGDETARFPKNYCWLSCRWLATGGVGAAGRDATNRFPEQQIAK